MSAVVPIERRCRCLGRQLFTLPNGQRVPVNNSGGSWCGNPANEEDGLCDTCRGGCREVGHHVCTLDEVRLRDQLDAGGAP